MILIITKKYVKNILAHCRIFLKGGIYSMVTKELIKKEIENLPEENLDGVFKIIKDFEQFQKISNKRSFMFKLRNIKIDGPKDFSKNIDVYISGEKNVE